MTDLELIAGLIKVIEKHEQERPEFVGTDYSEYEWDVITRAIIRVRQS